MTMADKRKKWDDGLRSSLCIGNPLGHRNEQVQDFLMNRIAFFQESDGCALLFQHFFIPGLSFEALLTPLGSLTAMLSSCSIVPSLVAGIQHFADSGKFSAGMVYFVFPFQGILSVRTFLKEVSSVDPTNSHRLRLWSFYNSQRGHPRLRLKWQNCHRHWRLFRHRSGDHA